MVPKFKEADRDGNGFITLEEASAILQQPPFNFPSTKVKKIPQQQKITQHKLPCKFLYIVCIKYEYLNVVNFCISARDGMM